MLNRGQGALSGFPSQSRPIAELAASAARIPFRDPQLARQNLALVSSKLSPLVSTSLPALLEETPDPDCALIMLERLLSESTRELHRLLDRHPFLAHYAIAVFGHSRFLGETLIRNLDLFQSFLREKNLDRSFSREEFAEALARFRSRSFETDASLLLARFKRREYVRIMLRDVLKIAPLAETTAEISGLADVLIEDALREAESRLQSRFGLPQHLDERARLASTPFVVLSLGKLGGRELNYSSDVDLVYVYGDGNNAPDSTISNHEYFIRLAQQVTEILSRVTAEGPVFRIDLRLRPQGHEGELAIGLAQALRYYADTANDWELQGPETALWAASSFAACSRMSTLRVSTSPPSRPRWFPGRRCTLDANYASTANHPRSISRSITVGFATLNSWCNACSVSMAARSPG
ncbi:MAG: hypothetical protein DMG68_04160 [Acidobacteria bacterium]|nr:MAG: hypothetical protein DMG68_04160 [Acidobacteriota bacterium]